MDPNRIRKLRAYCDALLAAKSATDSAQPKPEEPQAVVDSWRRETSNLVLAGSGDKAALLGTLSSEPTVDAAQLCTLGLDADTAAEIVDDATAARAEALKRRAEIGQSFGGAVPKELER